MYWCACRLGLLFFFLDLGSGVGRGGSRTVGRPRAGGWFSWFQGFTYFVRGGCRGDGDGLCASCVRGVRCGLPHENAPIGWVFGRQFFLWSRSDSSPVE